VILFTFSNLKVVFCESIVIGETTDFEVRTEIAYPDLCPALQQNSLSRQLSRPAVSRPEPREILPEEVGKRTSLSPRMDFSTGLSYKQNLIQQKKLG